jgi:predicted small lipoprotein YifL
MIRNTITLSGALALLLATGCGNKGPLYLPQQDTGVSDTQVIDQASESRPGGEASE